MRGPHYPNLPSANIDSLYSFYPYQVSSLDRIHSSIPGGLSTGAQSSTTTLPTRSTSSSRNNRSSSHPYAHPNAQSGPIPYSQLSASRRLATARAARRALLGARPAGASLSRESADLSDEEAALQDEKHAINAFGHRFLLPVGRRLTQMEMEAAPSPTPSDHEHRQEDRNGVSPGLAGEMDVEGEVDAEAEAEEQDVDLDEGIEDMDNSPEREEGYTFDADADAEAEDADAEQAYDEVDLDGDVSDHDLDESEYISPPDESSMSISASPVRSPVPRSQHYNSLASMLPRSTAQQQPHNQLQQDSTHPHPRNQPSPSPVPEEHSRPHTPQVHHLTRVNRRIDRSPAPPVTSRTTTSTTIVSRSVTSTTTTYRTTTTPMGTPGISITTPAPHLMTTPAPGFMLTSAQGLVTPVPAQAQAHLMTTPSRTDAPFRSPTTDPSPSLSTSFERDPDRSTEYDSDDLRLVRDMNRSIGSHTPGSGEWSSDMEEE